MSAGAARRVEARAGTDARRETDVLGDEAARRAVRWYVLIVVFTYYSLDGLCTCHRSFLAHECGDRPEAVSADASELPKHGWPNMVL